MNDRIRFGIIGCGMIANIHARALLGMEGVELVGAADHDSLRAGEFAARYGIAAYPDVSAMLEDSGIHAVCICTPSGFHADGAIEALSHGKHVVLEKPMALDVESADRIVSACEANHCLLTVISQLRFSEDIRHVRQLVREGAFGRLTMCSLYMKYWRDPEYYSSSPWKGTSRFDGGGALMNQGIHGVDLLQYIVGDVQAAAAITGTLTHDIEVEDTAAALLTFENGAMGVIEASTCTYPGFDRRLEIIGDRGHVILRENTIEHLCIDGKAEDISSRSSDIGTASDPSVLDCRMHALQIANLAAAIRGEEELLIDAAEGRKAVKIIRDIYALAGQNGEQNERVY